MKYFEINYICNLKQKNKKKTDTFWNVPESRKKEEKERKERKKREKKEEDRDKDRNRDRDREKREKYYIV